MPGTYLFEAANVLRDTGVDVVDVEGVGDGLAKRSGATKAKVALARKLAAILHRPGATARASAGRRRRSADDGLNNEIRPRRTACPSGRCDGHPAGTVGARQSRPTPLATLGGRSAQRHHGVDAVPPGENSGPGSDIRVLRSRPQLAGWGGGGGGGGGAIVEYGGSGEGWGG